MKKTILCILALFSITAMTGCTFECRKDLNAKAEILRANGIDPVEYGLYDSDGFFRVIWRRITTGKLLGERIEQLNLSSENITVLPSILGTLTELRTLRLNYNQISILPKEIGNLSHLWDLDLAGNQLKYLPEEIGQCTKLTRLMLQANELDTLPHSIGNLNLLKEFDISNNKLRKLPPTIGGIKNVAILQAHDNLLSELPDGMAEMTGLAELHIDRNNFVVFPAVCTTMALSGFRVLGISDNPLDTTTIPVDVQLLSPHNYISDCLELWKYAEKDYWIAETKKLGQWSSGKK